MTQATENELIAKLQAEVVRLKEENQKLRSSNRRWMRIAGTDSHTGLPNKVFFTTAMLPQSISQADADGQPVGCVMIAPDKLGEYNQKYGRKGGDQIVKGLADFLSENAEDGEKLVHVDGANFILLVPNGDLARTKRRCLTLRGRVLTRQFECVDNYISLTLSFGYVSRSPSPTGAKVSVKDLVEEFLRRLEAALDQAKQMGGDRPYEDSETNF